MTRSRPRHLSLALSSTIVACGPHDELGETVLDSDASAQEQLDAGDPGSIEAATRRAIRHVEQQLDHDTESATSVHVRRVAVDHQGRTHVRLQQAYHSIPVFGAEAIVHLRDDGSLSRVTDDLVRDIHVDPEPDITAPDAVDIAILSTGGHERITGSPSFELVVVRRDDHDHLAYRVRIQRLEPGGTPGIPVVFVDAHTGEPISTYDDLQRVVLQDDDAATFDMLQWIDYGAALPADSLDPVANDAHTHVLQTLDFFSSELGRDSFDGTGARVDSFVHFFIDFTDAFWDGQRLTFGDGDGIEADPLVSLDIVAHEFSHGVTTYTAGLIYEGESGALNEATSDIFAAATEAFVDETVDQGTWMIAEEVWTPGIVGDALRYMHDPVLDGFSAEHYSTRYLGAEDNGGVHTNSGIANLFFYLLSQGGEHPNPAHHLDTVAGVGIDVATQIWYAALVNEMTPNTSFAEARVATLASCADLFGAGAAECTSVERAWCEVGVGDCAVGSNSCEDHCGDAAPGGCYCDPLCVQYGDCCPDYVAQCLAGEPSCEGACGGQSLGECWCEPMCVQYGDCCPDYAAVCP